MWAKFVVLDLDEESLGKKRTRSTMNKLNAKNDELIKEDVKPKRKRMSNRREREVGS